MKAQLLPHYFKRIGLLLFLLGFIPSFIVGFTASCNCTSGSANEFGFLDSQAIWIFDLVSIAGILLYALAKEKIYDELFRQLRMEAMQLTFFVSVVIIFVGYLIEPDFEIDPSYLLNLQIIGFLLIYWLKKKNASAVYH